MPSVCIIHLPSVVRKPGVGWIDVWGCGDECKCKSKCKAKSKSKSKAKSKSKSRAFRRVGVGVELCVLEVTMSVYLSVRTHPPTHQLLDQHKYKCKSHPRTIPRAGCVQTCLVLSRVVVSVSVCRDVTVAPSHCLRYQQGKTHKRP